jgi:exodeoxyribonuclease VII large subunit
MAADRRAATPSAAAELLSPDQHDWQQRLQTTEGNLVRAIQRKLAAVTTHLTHLSQRLKHPGAQLRERAQRLDELEERLLMAQKNVLLRHRGAVALLENRVMAQSPLPRLELLQRDTLLRRKQLETAMRQRLQDCGNRLTHMAQMLDSLSPLGTLQRGYAIVTDSNGLVVREAGSVSIGDKIEARVANGRLGLTVKRVD